MRTATVQRFTNETQIECSLLLEGRGQANLQTGCGFLDHMLDLFTRHGRFDITLSCKGDTYVDYHHTTEDVGIVLGRAFAQALGDCAGIYRYGSMLLPMDEALVQVAVDISGRGGLYYKLEIPTEKIGDFDSQLVQEFFAAFVRGLACTLHIRQLEGVNSHHIAEGAFKGVARALARAVAINPETEGEIPSTKGSIV